MSRFLSVWSRIFFGVDAAMLLIIYFIDPFSNELCGA
jgi:hypothetical protein